MISHKLWRVLRLPLSPVFGRLLHLTQVEQSGSWWYALFVTLILLFLPLLLIFAVPAILNVFGFQKAQRVAGAIAQQFRTHKGDIIGVTPIGSMGAVIHIARTFCQSMMVSPQGMASIWVVATVGLGFVFLLARYSPDTIFKGVFIVAVVVAALFTDYAQSIIWSATVGILAGINGEVVNARLIVLAAYLAIQGLLYGALIVVMLMIVPPMLRQPSIGMFELLLVLFLALFFSVREVVIYVAWRKICERTNDELPALNTISQRGHL